VSEWKRENSVHSQTQLRTDLRTDMRTDLRTDLLQFFQNGVSTFRTVKLGSWETRKGHNEVRE
jgi:hypothetical protein